MKTKRFSTIVSLCFLLVQSAVASYDFSPANPSMVGTFNSTYTVPFTVGCWIKFANHPESGDFAFVLHKDANNDEMVAIETSGTADRFDYRHYDAAGSQPAFHTSDADEYNGVWVAIVGTSESTSIWNIFVELITNTHERSASRDPGALGKISIGTSPAGTGDWVNKIAECGVWNAEESDANITSFLSGTCAANIDSGNLVGYWPLDTDNSTQSNEGTDTGGDLTVTAATFDADHPAITCGGSSFGRRRRMQQ